MTRADRAPLAVLAAVATALVLAVVAPLWAPAPWEFTSRPRLPSCGEVDTHRSFSTDARACLFSARAERDGAELSVTRFTRAGSPVRTYYRNLPGQPGLELFEDAASPERGDERWRHRVCPAAVSVTRLGTCRDAGT